MKPAYHRTEFVTLKNGNEAKIVEYPKRVSFGERSTLGNYAYEVECAGAKFTVGEKEIDGAITKQRPGA